MNTSLRTDGQPSREQVAVLPRWLLICGWLVVAGTLALEARLVWEQTLLTWDRGPQMVGFSLAHGYAGFLLVFPLVLFLWVLPAVGVLGFRFIRLRRISSFSLFTTALSITLLLLLFVPYGFWQRLFADRLAKGPYAGEFIVYAAATGDIGTVRALVSHGAPVDSRNRQGKTGLHGAAGAGQLAVAQYLIAAGADPNAIDRFGDSPMELARSGNHPDVTNFLAGHGGQTIRGDEAQRQKAIEEIVREDIERVRP